MKEIIIVLVIIVMSGILWCEAEPETVRLDTLGAVKPEITFLEFGSTTCVPCKMMEKVMEEVETEYADQVAVIFHNVNEERKISKEYEIKMIPTQVFLDRDGQEFHRHIGYYPLEEIAKIFIERGIKPTVK